MGETRPAELPLAHPALDRDAARRAHPALFDELREDSATRVLPLWNGKALLRRRATDDHAGGQNLRLWLRQVDEVSAALTRVYLGRTVEAEAEEPCGTPIVVQTLTDAAAAELEPDTAAWGSLRASAASLSPRDAGIFAEALAIVNWHETATHCPRCGTPTVMEQGGWVRRCFADDTMQFPRTDAAVIVAITDEDDRLLLGSNAMWEHNRFSVLAGFVEPGESFEAAVTREVREEAGIHITDARYIASQPWPFPASLMVGMTASVRRDDARMLRPDGEEILSLRWFTRAQLWQERDELMLPGAASIARMLIERWYGGPLAAPPDDGVAP